MKMVWSLDAAAMEFIAARRECLAARTKRDANGCDREDEGVSRCRGYYRWRPGYNRSEEIATWCEACRRYVEDARVAQVAMARRNTAIRRLERLCAVETADGRTA